VLIRRWCGMKCGCERDECGREMEPCIVVMAIEEAPSIDIVHCGECKWWNYEMSGCKRNPSVVAWRDDDFCSYGERKESE
jgi:hypothetical protein